MWKQNSEKCSELAKLPYFHFLGPILVLEYQINDNKMIWVLRYISILSSELNRNIKQFYTTSKSL